MPKEKQNLNWLMGRDVSFYFRVQIHEYFVVGPERFESESGDSRNGTSILF